MKFDGWMQTTQDLNGKDWGQIPFVSFISNAHTFHRVYILIDFWKEKEKN